MTDQELCSAIEFGEGPNVHLQGEDINLAHLQGALGFFSGILALTYMEGVEVPYLRNGIEAT